jgi:hypothetical protein
LLEFLKGRELETIRTVLQIAVCVVLLNANWLGIRASAHASEPTPGSAPQSARQMAGRVLDGDGSPVEGADVYLFAREAADKPETRRGAARTEADGKYRFENLSNRAYIVAVTAPGFARAYRLVKLQDDDRLAADVAVRRPGVLSVLGSVS